MSRTATRPHRSTEQDERPQRKRVPIAAVAAVVVALGAVLLALTGSDDDGEPAPTVGPMGGEMVDVAMERSGVAVAGPVEVVGSWVEMGDVPLNVTVVPSWTIENSGSEPVVLGEPHASVLEGCCPGPLLLDVRTLAPGERTELSFPLQMHPGMDGPHHFAVHVPVGSGDEVLELHTAGDFHN